MSAAGAARAPKVDRGKSLTNPDYQALEARWINRELADAARLRRVDDQEGASVLGRKGHGNYAGILIPYFFAGAAHPHTYRVRRDSPETEKGKPKNKYLAPPGENRVYFPPGTDTKWLADTTLPLVITEGEFKTLSLSRLALHNLGDAVECPRFLAIGLGGVNNWRGKIGISVDQTGTRVPDKGIITDLSLVKCKARDVMVLFDADLESNPAVRAARMGFTDELWKRGARVRWFAWPKNLPAGAKGIDDFLADPAGGPELALELIRTAPNARDSVRLWTWRELKAANFPPPVAIAEDFLHEGETIALVGKPKQGKSRLIQMFAINAVRGEPFIGHAMTKRRRVLILDLENRPVATRNRVLKLAAGDDAALEEHLVFYVPDTLMGNRLTLLEKNGPKLLERALEEASPDILIIDNWRLFLGGDENNHEVVVRGLKIVSSLRSIAPNLAIVIVHHTRKQQQQGENQPRLRIDPSGWVEGASGHYAFIGHLDSCFGLERETTKEGHDLIVFGGVARNIGPRTLLLQEDRENTPDHEATLTFSLLADQERIEGLFTPVELGLWYALRQLPEQFRFSDVQSVSPSKNTKAVASMLRKATNMRLLSHPDKMIYCRRRETVIVN